MSKATATDFLIIGYGNTLRSDDGIGPRVADAIACWQLPHVRAIAAPQLTPEMAEALATAEVAIFVDAQQNGPSSEVTFKPLNAASEALPTNAHISDPRRLLALTKHIYGRCPQAWLISVPGVNFDFGESLSEQARQGVEVALRRIRLLFTSR